MVEATRDVDEIVGKEEIELRVKSIGDTIKTNIDTVEVRQDAGEENMTTDQEQQDETGDSMKDRSKGSR